MKTSMAGMTQLQAEVLGFIQVFVHKNGFPPTRGEISAHFGWRPLNSADIHIQALAKRGRLRVVKGASRGLQVIRPTSVPDRDGETLKAIREAAAEVIATVEYLREFPADVKTVCETAQLHRQQLLDIIDRLETTIEQLEAQRYELRR